jgi:hypothetical protein
MGQCHALCRHVAIFIKATVGELPDLYHFLPLPFVNIVPQVRTFPHVDHFRMDRHTQNVDNLQSNNDALP